MTLLCRDSSSWMSRRPPIVNSSCMRVLTERHAGRPNAMKAFSVDWAVKAERTLSPACVVRSSRSPASASALSEMMYVLMRVTQHAEEESGSTPAPNGMFSSEKSSRGV